jgi:hypothetical protein
MKCADARSSFTPFLIPTTASATHMQPRRAWNCVETPCPPTAEKVLSSLQAGQIRGTPRSLGNAPILDRTQEVAGSSPASSITETAGNCTFSLTAARDRPANIGLVASDVASPGEDEATPRTAVRRRLSDRLAGPRRRCAPNLKLDLGLSQAGSGGVSHDSAAL